MQALPIAAAGLLDAAGRFDASAARTAAEPLKDPVRETIARNQTETEVKANAAVIRTADEMTGTLLDMFA